MCGVFYLVVEKYCLHEIDLVATSRFAVNHMDGTNNPVEMNTSSTGFPLARE
jgi:hypothetical protein